MDEHVRACLQAMLEEPPKRMQVFPVMSWQDASIEEALSYLVDEKLRRKVRIKPEPMCELGGVQYPMPMQEAPEVGELVWKASPNGWPKRLEWDAGMDIHNNLYHIRQIAAEAHSKAMLAVNAQAVAKAHAGV